MKIVRYSACDDIDVKFLDDFHYIKTTTYSNFIRGQVKNPYDKDLFGVGYIGVGKWKVKHNGKWSRVYLCWRHMIERCYHKKSSKQYPAYYAICTVCDEWHNFQNFEELYKEYPKCKAALLWWCNKKECNSFNIGWNKWLKEFLIEHLPTFPISNLCYKYAKKDVVHKLLDDYGYDLNIVGVRKAEGGVRAGSYKSCFDENGKGKNKNYDNYRPLFWYKDQDKAEYQEYYNIKNSRCYTEYGLKRTGCAGCPFGRDFEQELKIIEEYEPKLFVAVNNIFGNSYEYTRKYREFCKLKNEEIKNNKQ